MTYSPGVFVIWGAAAGAGVVLALCLHARRRGRVAAAFGDPDLGARLLGEDLRRRPWSRILLVAAGAVLIAAALADPRWGAAVTGDVRGAPVVLVLDASTSMLARDLRPDRLERERSAARLIAGSLEGVPIGIVAFAGRAYAIAPPTTDAGAIDLYLEALHPGMVTQSGSSLAAAVRQGLALLLSGEQGAGGSIVLITDGDTEEDPVQLGAAAAIAARAGVPVYALGAGTPAGATVPAHDFVTGRQTGVLTREDGQPIVSRLRDGFLREIARETGGIYLPLGRGGSAERIAAAVRERSVAGGSSDGREADRPARYAVFAALALLMLALETIVARRGGVLAAALVVGLTACDRPDREDPAALFEAGRYEEARDAYRQRLASAPRSPEVHYDIGASGLRLGAHGAARPHLEIAARTGDRRTRQWAFYNIGNSWLEPVIADSAVDAVPALTAAIIAYKRALLLRPADPDAKWNLELARRLLRQELESPRPRPDRGGGGGSDRDPGDERPRRSAAGGGSRPLSREEAEEVLDAAQERELGVQREALRKRQPPRISH